MKKYFVVMAGFVLFAFCLLFIPASQEIRLNDSPMALPNEDSPFGINTHDLPNGPNGVAAMDLAVEAGVKWIRVDLFWRSIETQPGVFDWGWVDTIYNYARNHGLNILGVLKETPLFYGGTAAGSHLPKAYLNQWETFVGNVVNRYKSYIKYWEIWNEPNLASFWNSGSNDGYGTGLCGGKILSPTVVGYLYVLKTAALKIKAVDPSAHVCGPALSSVDNAWSWMQVVLCSRGDLIDIITYHQYDSDRLAKIDAMHNNIVNYGFGNKPFWLTETGWAASSPIMERIQALYLNMMYTGMKARPWWNKTFWYMLRDVGTNTDGIIKFDNTKKLSWSEYKKIALN